MLKIIRIVALVAAVLWAPFAHAQGSVPPQNYAALKTLCAADSTCNGYMTSANDVAMAAWLNTVDSAWWVWRPDVAPSEARKVFDWTEIDALTVGKYRIWQEQSLLAVIDTRIANVRTGFSQAFAAAPNTLAAVTAAVKRNATRAERALSTGTGSNASPATMVWYGNVSYQDASLIRSS